MPWNEPGDGNKDPWGSNNDKGPPDLDEVVKKMQEKLGGLFGRGGGGDGNGSGPGSSSNLPKLGGAGIGVIAAVIVGLWLISGFYIVAPAEEGVVLRFGKYLKTTNSGLQWRVPFPVDNVYKVDVQGIQNRSIRSLMLTQDENFVDFEVNIQYRVMEPEKYLFKVTNPDRVLIHATEAAIREMIGRSRMDSVLTEGREAVAQDVVRNAQEIVNTYETGLLITEVTVQNAQPPDAVQNAFADVIRAREDRERFINEAEAYSNEVIPVARGEAARLLAEAEAYLEEKVTIAEGETSRFNQLLVEYKKAPEITEQRLYIEALESVLSRSNKVLVDLEGGNNVLYLPLDQMLSQKRIQNILDSTTGQQLRMDRLNQNGESGSSRVSDAIRGRGR